MQFSTFFSNYLLLLFYLYCISIYRMNYIYVRANTRYILNIRLFFIFVCMFVKEGHNFRLLHSFPENLNFSIPAAAAEVYIFA